MLEQKHNKRAAISQANSNSNPNWPSPVTSAPSNPLRWTNLREPSWGERKQWSQPFRVGIKRWPAYFSLQMKKASGRMTEAKRSRVLTNWNPKLSWQTKIYCDCGDLRSPETQVTQMPRAGFSWSHCLPLTHFLPFCTFLQKIACLLKDSYRMWGMPTPPWRIL